MSKIDDDLIRQCQTKATGADVHAVANLLGVYKSAGYLSLLHKNIHKRKGYVKQVAEIEAALRQYLAGTPIREVRDSITKAICE